MTKIRNLTGKAAERSLLAVTRHQAKLREDEHFAGLLTVTEAAAIVKRTRQGILKAIKLGHLHAIHGPRGREWWIEPATLSRVFPPTVRNTRRPWTRLERPSDAQHREALRAELFRPGSPEWDASKQRQNQ